MEQEVVTAAAKMASPHWLEVVAWVATIILSGTAIWAALFAKGQVEAARDQARAALEANQQSVRLAKAAFLFELDRMYESTEFANARAEFFHLHEKIKEQIKSSHQHQTEEAKDNALREEISRRLYVMRSDDKEPYLKFLKLCGFFETVGLLERQGYVSLNDIVGLYGGSIDRLERALRAHIKNRAEEPDMPEGYMEHFLSLAQKTREKMAQRQ